MDCICGVDNECIKKRCIYAKILLSIRVFYAQCLLEKGIYCSLILKPSRDLPIRVTSHQLYFLNFVLWPAFVVLMRYVVFPLITLKSKGVGMANLTTTQNVFLRREFSALWF